MSGTTNITGHLPGVRDARCRAAAAAVPRQARAGADAPDGGRAPGAGRQRPRRARSRAGAAALSRRARGGIDQLRGAVEGGARAGGHRQAGAGQGRLVQASAGQPLYRGAGVRRGGGARQPRRRRRTLHGGPGAGPAVAHQGRKGAGALRQDHLRRRDEGDRAGLDPRRRLSPGRRVARRGEAALGFPEILREGAVRWRLPGQGQLGDAQTYLEKAVALKPQNIFHRLDLAEVYVDLGRYSKAREQLTTIASLPIADVLDHDYQKEAAQLLDDIKGEKDER